MAGTPPSPDRRPSQTRPSGGGPTRTGGGGESGGGGGGSGGGRRGAGNGSGGAGASGRGSGGGSGRGSGGGSGGRGSGRGGGGGRRRAGSSRPTGTGGGRQGRGGSGRSGSSNRGGRQSGDREVGTGVNRERVRETEPVTVRESERPAVPILPGARGDTGEFHHNRRRALAIAAAPGVVVFALVTVFGIVAGIGLIGTAAGVGVGLVLWLTLWRGATRILLRALGARPGDEVELARAENIVDGLCATMGVDPPDIVMIDERARQAMALGRKSGAAVLVVTSGLLHSLDPVALEGVLAHELVHVKRADVAPATMAAVVLLPWAAFFPVSGLVHGLAGRGREFRTDRLAVGVTRYPPGLRDALVLMADGPTPQVPSPLARRGVARTTRWLWTVAMPDAPGGDVMRRNVIGELDAPALRVAALDEW